MRHHVHGLAVLLTGVLISGIGVITAGAQVGNFSSASYSVSTQFVDALGGTTTGLAYDGSNYWSVSGNDTFGNREASYSGGGTNTGLYAPGLDFRSIFTDAAGNVYARQYNSTEIYKQTAPGVFTNFVNLAGFNLRIGNGPQSSVVLNGAGNEYIAMDNGNVYEWDLSGNYLGAVTLNGFGTQPGENSVPQDRGIAVDGNYFLTYNDGLLSAWDQTGQRAGTTTLVGAGNSSDAEFGFSFANNAVWINNVNQGLWNGYSISLGNASSTPEGSSLAMLALGGLPLAIGFGRKFRRKTA